MPIVENDDDVELPKKPAPDGELDITSLIDCVFLLLIFFMVTSTMTGEKELDVPPARLSMNSQMDGATMLFIVADPSGGTAQIFIGDGEAPVALEVVRQTIEAATQQVPPKMHVIINAERAVKSGFVQEVARTITSVEGVKFSVGVKEGK